ncbi:MAG: RraA family protein [Rhodospirillales bacterium]|nr:RraA family protein [Rhodospirillales bacterium]
MTEPLTTEEISGLREYSTTTISNVIEVLVPDRRGRGFTIRPVTCAFPDLKPMVGYAKTVTIKASERSSLSAEAAQKQRGDYLDYLAAGPHPTISVVQDVDEPAGQGTFWGKRNAVVHKKLGCDGVLTNGIMRDTNTIIPDFQLLVAGLGVSHSFVHTIEFDTPVEVYGLTVSSGDLIHGDAHGAVIVPPEVVREIPKALDYLKRRGAAVGDALDDPGFTVEKLKAAYQLADDIKV